jgi:diguanylate cyclase
MTPAQPATRLASAPNLSLPSANRVDGAKNGPLAALAGPRVVHSHAALGQLRTLLDGVKATLQDQTGTASAPRSAPPAAAPESNGTNLAPLTAPECIEVIDQLYVWLKHELARQALLEQEVCSVQAVLSKTRAELLGAQVTARRAHRLALHDSLTALPNRRFFRDRLDQALLLAAPQRRALAVLYLDLDGFKAINDAHGHDVGDELLKIIASRLTRAVRAEDVVSRLGGDEYACLVADFPNRKQLTHLARKLFLAIAAPCKLGTLHLIVRPSIGIALCPSDGETVDALLKSADAAMYYAKRRGSGCAFFDQRVGG